MPLFGSSNSNAFGGSNTAVNSANANTEHSVAADSLPADTVSKLRFSNASNGPQVSKIDTEFRQTKIFRIKNFQNTKMFKI